jgi:hypothetical protein
VSEKITYVFDYVSYTFTDSWPKPGVLCPEPSIPIHPETDVSVVGEWFENRFSID